MPLFFKSPFMSFSKVLQFLMKYPFLLSLLVSILFFIPIVNGSFVPKKKKKIQEGTILAFLKYTLFGYEDFKNRA